MMCSRSTYRGVQAELIEVRNEVAILGFAHVLYAIHDFLSTGAFQSVADALVGLAVGARAFDAVEVDATFQQARDSALGCAVVLAM